ncbi:fumarylacetoacetate hydrolase family protein [Sphingobium sp. JS3065]|jgi:fumarylpyruvate hydrolase|uniref:fumarylacetoacetate hydrolase family protein n=1 Tax=Sphingobium sp. JS3065 TaxID=2970925 RepID=UPI002263BFCE|nr:fumarylacetoacetate hydrolase family protein [Sphingobium sp. JS3065]UZW57470.1 fumarylacetoacetate hydrolase family protein [Sphingobium sp. JS3065]
MRNDEYIFDAPPVVSVAVEGEEKRFPVRRIYCVGRNYAEHIREMGADERQSPFFFQKPADAIVENGAAVAYPPFTKDFQYEIELVLAIGKGGVDIAVDDAANHIFGVAAGIDLTRRDVQIEARKTGRPWEIGKSFDASAPIGTIVPLKEGVLPEKGALSLRVNDEIRQRADIADMIWNSAEIVSQLSRQYTLVAGDLIYTGTPAGVGPINPGDEVVGEIEGVGTIRVTITDPR